MSLRKKLFFSAVAAILFLAAVSGLLKLSEKTGLFSFSRPDDRVIYYPTQPLLQQTVVDGKRVWRIRHPAMLDADFPFNKPPNLYRVAVVGGSFAMGSPYLHQAPDYPNQPGSIGHFVVGELGLRFPSRQVELVNAAVGAVSSGVVAETAREIARMQPDVMLVMTGNNEGYVPFADLNKVLHKWVLYRMLKKAIKPGVAPEQRSYFAPQDPDTQKIIDNYEKNIRAMVEVGRDFSVPILLCTLPIHRQYEGPDPGMHGTALPPTPDDPKLTEGDLLQDQGKYAAALKAYAESENPVAAVGKMARCQEILGRYDEALALYDAEVEANPKNRTRPSVNQILRNVASETSTGLVDLDARYRQNSSTGLGNPALFVDYCHMTWRGYQQLAEAIVDQIIGQGMIVGVAGEPLPRPNLDAVVRAIDGGKLYRLP